GRARAWTLRAVRARHDPAWTADGYVSDRWRPVSPVTGRLDAFQWQTPVASLPSDKRTTIESSAFEEAMLAPPAPRREVSAGGNGKGLPNPPPGADPRGATPFPSNPATQENGPQEMQPELVPPKPTPQTGASAPNPSPQQADAPAAAQPAPL